MLFQLKTHDQKNKQNHRTFYKIDTFKSIIKKVKFVAKNVIYVKKWSQSSETFEKIHLENKDIYKCSRDINLNLGTYELKTIDDSNSLIFKVKKLRQKSFFKETHENSVDSDEFDKFCDHLVVIDKSVSDDHVVGTYRLLLKSKFVTSRKFYSQSEFDISKLIKKKSLILLEAGRSCVHEDYRDGRIIKLLWRGLATFIVRNKVDVIFGCASFPSSNPKLFANQLSYLHHFHMPPKSLRTKPLKNLKAEYRIVDKKLINAEDEFRKLPPLIKAYIRAGAFIGSGAVVDKKFNTTDVLIVLESKKIVKKYSQLQIKNTL